MGMIGTFDGFTASRLGIYAAQQALRVTGNNIANINTAGYTRQRADQSSFKAGANDMYRSHYDNHVGSGALVTGISQIRDPFLDIRYRSISTETYHLDTWLAGLQDIASILDEVGKGENGGDGLIYAQLLDMAEKLRAYSANPTNSNDGLVRESASSLAALFRYAAGELDRLYNNTKASLDNSITEVNDILTNIRNLNKSIREAEIHGDAALEMRDERNRQIDALSQYLDIDVKYSFENIGAGLEVEKLTITLGNANPDDSVTTDSSILVDGVYATQLSIEETKPYLNPYVNSEDGSEYSYLKDYKYLKEATWDELSQFMEDIYGVDPFMGSGDLTFLPVLDEKGEQKTDKDGNPLYYIGTNYEKDAARVENDNFTIQLGKLLNSKGEEWLKSETTRTEITDWAKYLANAKFTYAVSGDNLKVGSSFGIAGDVFEIVASGAPVGDRQISIDEISSDGGDTIDPEKFAKFVADHLDYQVYDISSDAQGQIIFTLASNVNPADVKAPPALSVSDPGGTKLISVGPMMVFENPVKDEYDNIITSVSYSQVNGKWIRTQIDTTYTHEIALDDNDLHGIIQAQRELLTEEGEFSSDYDVLIDEQAAIKRGIPYYLHALDLLAQRFAEEYNKLNMGYYVDQNGNYLDVDNKVLELEGAPVNQDPGKLTAEQRKWFVDNGYYLKNEKGQAIDKNGNVITDENGNPITFPIPPAEGDGDDGDDTGDGIDYYEFAVVDLDRWMEDQVEIERVARPGGPLFSTGNNGDETEGINAHNIDISRGWSHGEWTLVPKYEKIFIDDSNPDGMAQSTQNTNADRMLALIDKSLKYNPNDLYDSDATGPLLFEGSFNDFLSKIMSVEASDERITNTKLTNSAISLTELDYSREGVSGVDLNDEAMNMMQFSKAMNAAMRVMTVIDETLDRLINNTGVAGR